MLLLRIFANASPAPRQRALSAGLQIVSAAFMAFSHGSNDAQKTMGIITLALVSTATGAATTFEVPLWVII